MANILIFCYSTHYVPSNRKETRSAWPRFMEGTWTERLFWQHLYFTRTYTSIRMRILCTTSENVFSPIRKTP